jgi:transposase-like protein
MPAKHAKFTPDRRQKIIEAIQAGNYNIVAARYGGITKDCFYKWMQRGEREQSGEYREFSDAVKDAEAVAEVRAEALIQAAALGDKKHPGQWQAAAWYLERRHPDRWSRKERVELSGNKDSPVRFAWLKEDDPGTGTGRKATEDRPL